MQPFQFLALSIFILAGAAKASAEVSVNDSLFRNIAQENYDSQKGRSTYGLVGVGSPCEIWISGTPGSFRVISYLSNVPEYGGPVPGNRYYFEDATVSAGKLSWTSWDNKIVEPVFDPTTYKITNFNDEKVGCQL